jgi:hypothetical protein
MSGPTSNRSYADAARAGPGDHSFPSAQSIEQASTGERSVENSSDSATQVTVHTEPSELSEGAETSTSNDAENVDKLPDFVRDQCLICCIDLEANCFNQSSRERAAGIVRSNRRVCEVGMAFADTRSLEWDERGDRWNDAFHHVQRSAKDFVITEHQHQNQRSHGHWCNVGKPSDFAYGNPAGKPDWISKDDAKERIVQQVCEVLGGNISSSPDGTYRSNTRVIFLFLGGANDKIWLAQMGIHLTSLFPNSEYRDIQEDPLVQALGYTLEKPLVGAKTVLLHLGLNAIRKDVGWEADNAHNGGNDAVHELQAYLALLALTADQKEWFKSGIPLPDLVLGAELPRTEAPTPARAVQSSAPLPAPLAPAVQVAPAPAVQSSAPHPGPSAPVVQTAPTPAVQGSGGPLRPSRPMIQPALPLGPVPARFDLRPQQRPNPAARSPPGPSA